jgi:ABC-type uncharacterized transport system permease subunit
MDPFNMAFYALICGSLAGMSPRLGTTLARIIAGCITGLLAAAALPYLRALFGVS